MKRNPLVLPDRLSGKVREHLRGSVQVIKAVADQSPEAILAAAHLLAESFQAGGKLLLCGNGGSAADCQHMAAELVSRLTRDFKRPGLPAIALTTDTSFLTAYTNDVGFAGVFERQIMAIGRPGDVLLAISTSGNSPNILRAVKAATKKRMATIALTGAGGRLREIARITITIPSSDTQYIQEASLAIEHILCVLVEVLLFRPRAAVSRGKR